MQKGKRHSELKGNLKKWLSGEFRRHGAHDARIYGAFCFFFKRNNLVTVFQLPRDFSHAQ